MEATESRMYRIRMTWDNPYLRNSNGGDRDVCIYLSLAEAKEKMLDFFNELFIGQINLEGGFAKNWDEAMTSLETLDGAEENYRIAYDSRHYTIEEMPEEEEEEEEEY